jgi:hypothetical protein
LKTRLFYDDILYGKEASLIPTEDNIERANNCGENFEIIQEKEKPLRMEWPVQQANFSRIQLFDDENMETFLKVREKRQDGNRGYKD